MNNNNKHLSHSHHNHGDMDHSKHEYVSMEEHGDYKDQHQEHHVGHDHSGHDGHDHHHHGNFKELFLKSLPPGIIIMLLSPMAGFELPSRFVSPYSDIVVAILSIILIIYDERPSHQGAVDEFK